MHAFSWTLILAIAVLGLVYVVAPVALAGWYRFRRPLAVPCPEAHAEATIAISPLSAMASEMRAPGRARFRVSRCSLWPGRAGCAQACTSALEGR